jgi:putative tricarboxylic transport membrane protein
MKTSRQSHLYGTGIPEGVIAADAATNSKDGGAFVPTLAFGIPGSAAMAIFLAAMIGIGVQPGQAMMTDNIDLVWMFIWILVIANVAAAALCIAFIGWMARVTFISIAALAPPVLVLSFFGAYASSNNLGDVWTAVAFGLVGLVMKRFGYSRSTFVIGFVLGILLERHYLLSMRLFGWEFLLRPITFALLMATVLVLVGPLIARLIKGLRRPKVPERAPEKEGTRR